MAITPLFNTGFETGTNPPCGLTNPGNTADANVTVSPSAARGSKYGMRIAAPLNTVAGYAFPFTSSVKVVGRIAFRQIVNAAASYGMFFTLSSGSGSVGLLQHSSGQLAWVAPVNGGTPQLTGFTPTIGKYHLLEFQIDGNNGASASIINTRVDGVDQTQCSFATFTMNQLWLGTNNAIWQAMTTEWDDAVVGTWTDTTNDWYGDGRGLLLPAGMDGTHSFTTGDFGIDDAGATQAQTFQNFFLQVADIPGQANAWVTTRNTNISQRVVRTTGYVEIGPAQTFEVGPANGVLACLSYSATGSAADTGGCVVRNGDGVATVIWGDLPSAQGGNGGALADYSETTNFFHGKSVPAPSAGWSPDQVELVRFRVGGSSDINPIPTWQSLALDVDWPLNGAVYPLTRAPGRQPIGA